MEFCSSGRHSREYLNLGKAPELTLISKIPPGGLCKPHTDTTWHAKYYDKYAVQLESHPDQAFCFEEGEHISPPGEVYWFNNQAVHWVRNNSPVDRITLIFCIKSDRRFSCLGE